MLIKSTLCVQLVLDSQKRVFSWGFGGYGRLGHAEQKDEMVPRLIKLFDFPGRGASQIYTGYQCSFAVTENGKNMSQCRGQDKTRSQVVEWGSSDQTAASYELPPFSTTSLGFALLNSTKCQISRVNSQVRTWSERANRGESWRLQTVEGGHSQPWYFMSTLLLFIKLYLKKKKKNLHVQSGHLHVYLHVICW